MQRLPIDLLLPEIVASLRRTPNLVIEAAPGAGKTTRVPSTLLDAGLASNENGDEICVLEPRRLAARLAAQRVAEERGERVGETIGYQVRFDEVASSRTRVRFVTEGILTRRLLRDPQLAGVGVVVLDEFHERHLQADLALALLRRLQRTTRPNLRVIVMSATLDVAPVAKFLDGCPVLHSEGRRFHVAIEHLTRPDERPLALQIEAAVRRLIADGLDGDVLVFLPGAREIGAAQEACAGIAREHQLVVLPLHGELAAAEQDRAVRGAAQRKIILSTNVAETSVTIEGVVAVIDSGLARIAEHSVWSGLPRLSIRRISRASAVQRAGRAGRTRDGRCLRLYTAQDFALRPEHTPPEIARLDLAEPVLELHAAGVSDSRAFEWFESPSADALDAAESLLCRLGAADEHGSMTARGRSLLRLPLHPRLARLVVEAEARGVGKEGCTIAALIGERDIRTSRIFDGKPERTRTHAAMNSPSDLLELLDRFAQAESVNFAPERLRGMNLDPSATRTVDRVRRQLWRLSKNANAREAHTRSELSSAQETGLLISILAGYPDRVARRRPSSSEGKQMSAEVLLAGGGTAEIAPESVVRQAEFLVAVDAEEKQERGRTGGRGARTIIHSASAIEPDWLLDLFTEAITETTEAVWNKDAARVEVVKRLMYEGLALDETRASEAGGEEVARVLAEAALAAGVESFVEGDKLERLLARIEFVARTVPENDSPVLGEDDVRASLIRLCEGRRSFAELKAAAQRGELCQMLRQRLSAEQQRLLATMAPERVTLGRGRQVRVNYERGQTPWIASRLQDFFGMKDTPKIAAGRVPVVLHLLAPNGRPVQVTSDLAGFWTRHYPQVRRELSRRYPRHDWRENPLGA